MVIDGKTKKDHILKITLLNLHASDKLDDHFKNVYNISNTMPILQSNIKYQLDDKSYFFNKELTEELSKYKQLPLKLLISNKLVTKKINYFILRNYKIVV